jgi:MFS family permease
VIFEILVKSVAWINNAFILAAFIIGFATNYFGLKLYYLFVFIIAFLVGALLGALAAIYLGANEVQIVFTALFLGVACGALYRALVDFIPWLIGFLLFMTISLLYFGSETKTDQLIALLIGAAGGQLTLFFSRVMMIFATSLFGSFWLLVAITKLLLDGTEQSYTEIYYALSDKERHILASYLAIFVSGVYWQYKYMTRSEIKNHESNLLGNIREKIADINKRQVYDISLPSGTVGLFVTICAALLSTSSQKNRLYIQTYLLGLINRIIDSEQENIEAHFISSMESINRSKESITTTFQDAVNALKSQIGEDDVKLIREELLKLNARFNDKQLEMINSI